jgi:periplasmic protein TonB
MTGLATAALFAALTIVPQAATSEDVIDDAAALYAAARYEEALATLGRAAEVSGIDRVALHQYRALCLFALGDHEAAAHAFTALVDADPHYDLPASIAAPRVRAHFAEARRRALPRIARRLLDAGRGAYEAGTLDEARDIFARLIGVLADAALEEWPDRRDVRLLADGFVVLLAGVAAREAVTMPDPISAPGDATAEDVTATARFGEAEAAASPADGAAGASERSADANTGAPGGIVEPPVAVLQAMPPWVPPSGVMGSHRFTGLLRVKIGTDGRVVSAHIDEPSHPAYDARLLHAARQWVFRPATRNGEPVASEQVIAVQLHPR